MKKENKIIEYFRKIAKENKHPIRESWFAFLTLIAIILVVDFGLAGLIELILITGFDHPIFYTDFFDFIISNHHIIRLGLYLIIGIIIYKKIKISDAYNKAFLSLFIFSFIIRVFLIIF